MERERGNISSVQALTTAMNVNRGNITRLPEKDILSQTKELVAKIILWLHSIREVEKAIELAKSSADQATKHAGMSNARTQEK